MKRMFNFQPDEFIVEEITRSGVQLEAGKEHSFPDELIDEKKFFSRFVLEKRAWTTPRALGAVARALHAKASRFNAAGNKDRNAVTVQLCSAFCVQPERLLSIRVKDISIRGAWLAKEKVRMGELKGNRFTITLNKENCGVEPDANEIRRNAEHRQYLFRNYFGYQRFGSSRSNTAAVGLHLLKGDFEAAAKEYLFGEGDSQEEAIAARSRLKKDLDYKAALDYYPHWLKLERSLLGYLSLHPTDYAGALRKFPRGISLLFIHAMQSELFNEELRAFDGEQSESLEGNLVGFESEANEFERAWLEERGLSIESFRLPRAPELASKGNKRKLFARLENFEVLSESPVKLRFSLGSGCYATTALEELLEQ